MKHFMLCVCLLMLCSCKTNYYSKQYFSRTVRHASPELRLQMRDVIDCLWTNYAEQGYSDTEIFGKLCKEVYIAELNMYNAIKTSPYETVSHAYAVFGSTRIMQYKHIRP